MQCKRAQSDTSRLPPQVRKLRELRLCSFCHANERRAHALAVEMEENDTLASSSIIEAMNTEIVDVENTKVRIEQVDPKRGQNISARKQEQANTNTLNNCYGRKNVLSKRLQLLDSLFGAIRRDSAAVCR